MAREQREVGTRSSGSRRSRSRTRKERSRQAARAGAERQIWADMFEGTDDPIAAVDSQLRVIAANRAYLREFARLFSTKLEIGDRLDEALAHMPQARDIAVALWRRALGGEVVDIPRSGEGTPDGAYYDIKFRPLVDGSGAAIGAFQYSRNVTQRVQANLRLREAQEALQRVQRMEALGQLTGGVAHDFNNLLQVISGNLQLLRRDLAGDAKAEQRIDGALAGVERGAKLAQQLLAFGRRQPLEPKAVNLGGLLKRMDEMLHRALGGAVELQTLVADDLWNTLVDPNQIDNAVLNLAINARDAMGGRGRLTIEAANAVLDESYARLNPEASPGAYVMVAVTDTGCGMTPEVAERALDPFFTTKPEGQGTGLGLSMVYGLVKQSGGHLKIYSEPGEGTTVRVYLPRTEAPETPASDRDAGADVGGGGATILVVEDDEAVRETAVALLQDLGYHVLAAADAAGALEFLESPTEIDLVFTDVVMPGEVRSTELVRRARQLRPGIAIVYTSGYTENAIVQGGRLEPGVDLLSKPYTREALARKMRQALASKGAETAPRES